MSEDNNLSIETISREMKAIEVARKKLDRELSQPFIQRAIQNAISNQKAANPPQTEDIVDRVIRKISSNRIGQEAPQPIIQISYPQNEPKIDDRNFPSATQIEIPTEGQTSAATCIGLALYVRDGDVWIGAGTVAGDLPSGFDPAEGKFIASGGSGNVWAEVSINQETGDVVSVAVTGGGTTPNDTDTSFYYSLGYYEYVDEAPTVTNYGCGSLDVTVCRNWFASEAPFYGVTINR